MKHNEEYIIDPQIGGITKHHCCSNDVILMSQLI